jgi:tau tubulin kinase
MELLGENLSTLRRMAPAHIFGMATTMALGMQMLRALKAVHCAGFVHRDLKPGNFVVGREGTPLGRQVIIIDFGLSKRHLLENGLARPKRTSARWVGSRRYMSPNTHLRKEQGRRDDLISLMYVLVEFATGTLPWAHLRGLANLDRVRDMKLLTSDDKLFGGLPDEFRQMMAHIRSLEYEDRPDYGLLHNLMHVRGLFSSTPPPLVLPWELTYFLSEFVLITCSNATRRQEAMMPC